MSFKSILKKIFIIAIILTIIICGIAGYLFFKKIQKRFYEEESSAPSEQKFNSSQSSTLDSSQIAAELGLQKARIDALNETVKAQTSVLENEKREVDRAIADLSGMKKTLSKDANYSPILLTLIALENKVRKGGPIYGEIVKLKIFSSRIPALHVIINQISDIKNLSSSEDLQKDFAEYVKNIKSIYLKKSEGKLAKILSIGARYFTVLNRNNKTDEVLAEAGEAIKNENFEKAYESLISLSLENNNRTEHFLERLSQTVRVQKASSEIYAFILPIVSEK